MKLFFILLIAALFANPVFSQDQFRVTQLIRPDQGEMNLETNIKGTRVMGVPFLYTTWYPGQIVLKNGQTYNNYQVNYNIYDQTLSFLEGSQSMDVTDPVNEFTIYPKVGNARNFLNSALYKKTNSVSYYELLVNSSKGQLLKLTEKVIASDIQFTRIDRFHIRQTYFYYDSPSQKIIQLKNKAKLSDLLKFSSAEKTVIPIESYDLSKEEDLINLFKAHFSYSGE